LGGATDVLGAPRFHITSNRMRMFIGFFATLQARAAIDRCPPKLGGLLGGTDQKPIG
jgi:hypothetical protein